MRGVYGELVRKGGIKIKRITNPETQWDVLGEVYNAVDRLREIENILGDEYDLEHLKELVQADREGKCVVLPFKVGDTLYYIGGACEMLIKSATVEEMYIEDEVLVGVSSGSEFFTLQEKEWYETEKDAEIALERMRERGDK